MRPFAEVLLEIAVSCMQVPGHRVQPSLIKEVRIPWLFRVNKSTSQACDASSLGGRKLGKAMPEVKGSREEGLEG